jgi:hypothetical protein
MWGKNNVLANYSPAPPSKNAELEIPKLDPFALQQPQLTNNRGKRTSEVEIALG